MSDLGQIMIIMLWTGLSCYIEALLCCGGEEKKIIHNVVKFYSSYLIDSLYWRTDWSSAGQILVMILWGLLCTALVRSVNFPF